MFSKILARPSVNFYCRPTVTCSLFLWHVKFAVFITCYFIYLHYACAKMQGRGCQWFMQWMEVYILTAHIY